MANFTDILNKPAESVEKPKPRPVGTYLCIVDGPHKQRDVKGKDGTEYPVVGFTLKTMQAQDDVNQTELAEAGGVGNKMNHDFFLANAEGQVNDYPLVNFLENHLGIERTGKSIAQMLAEAPGKQVLATIKHEIYTDKASGEPAIAARIGGIAKA
jgi:hypothetical protein